MPHFSVFNSQHDQISLRSYITSSTGITECVRQLRTTIHTLIKLLDFTTDIHLYKNGLKRCCFTLINRHVPHSAQDALLDNIRNVRRVQSLPLYRTSVRDRTAESVLISTVVSLADHLREAVWGVTPRLIFR